MQHLLSRQPQDLQETCHVVRSPRGELLVAPLDRGLSSLSCVSVCCPLIFQIFMEASAHVCEGRNGGQGRGEGYWVGHTQSMSHWGFPPVKTCNWAIWHQKAKAQEQPLTALSSHLSFSYSLCHALCCCSSYFDSKQQIFVVWLSWRPPPLFFQRTIEWSDCCWSGFWEKCNLCKKPPMGISAAFGTGEYSVELYFSPQAVIPFAVKRKERCKCFISRESVVPVSSDVLFILLY